MQRRCFRNRAPGNPEQFPVIEDIVQCMPCCMTCIDDKLPRRRNFRIEFQMKANNHPGRPGWLFVAATCSREKPHGCCRPGQIRPSISGGSGNPSSQRPRQDGRRKIEIGIGIQRGTEQAHLCESFEQTVIPHRTGTVPAQFTCQKSKILLP